MVGWSAPRVIWLGLYVASGAVASAMARSLAATGACQAFLGKHYDSW
jgi:hypothetical protein